MNEDRHPLSYADLRRFLGLLLLLGVAGVVVWRLADTILLFAVVFLIAMVVNPLVVWVQKRGVSRGLSVTVVLFGLLLVVSLVGWLVVPVVIEQVNQLAQKAPTYGETIRTQSQRVLERYPFLNDYVPDVDKMVDTAKGEASGAATWVLRSTFGLVGALFLGVISFLLLVFTLVNPGPLVSGLLAGVPARHRPAARRSVIRMTQQMAVWIKATLINGMITGTLTGTLLFFIGVQPAFVFGILAFFGEFVPNIGPVVTSAPALFVALGMGLEKAGMTLAAILFVQTLSGNILVPFIMGKQMELHPVAIVFFALGMGSLFGLTGAILAVPSAAACKILIDEFYLKPQSERGKMDGEAVKQQAAEVVDGKTPPVDEKADA